jgi:hypothetical protein
MLISVSKILVKNTEKEKKKKKKKKKIYSHPLFSLCIDIKDEKID